MTHRFVSGEKFSISTKKLFFISTIGIAGWYWHGGYIPFVSPGGAYDEGGNPAVWLLYINGCGESRDSARYELKTRRVDFEEKRIEPGNESDEDVKLWKRDRRNSLPLIVSGGEIRIDPSSAMMATAPGLSFGDKYLTHNEKVLFKKRYYADGSPKIVIYGSDWCQFCAKLRTEFNENEVDFTEIEVEQHPHSEKIVEVMEIYGYPATRVGYTRVNGSALKAVNQVPRSY